MVGGRRLDVLVEKYERSRAFHVIGCYAGLVLGRSQFGDLRRYLLGEREPWPGRRVPLLGCICGVLDCWPLVASVDLDGDIVRWSEFEQPHRPERDYWDFGPFVFDRAGYDEALEAVAE